MSISGVSSNYSIQSLFVSDESKRTAVAGQTSVRAASGDSVTISDEARAMFFSLKNSSSSSTGDGAGDVDVEEAVRKYYDDYRSSMFGAPPPNYSAWLPENVEKLHKLWADVEAVDGGKIVHPQDRTPEQNARLEELGDKISVLMALGEDVVVTDAMLLRGAQAVKEARVEWDAKENTRPILDGNGAIVSLDGDDDPDKVEGDIKKWQDDELLKLHDDELPDEQETSSVSTRKPDRLLKKHDVRADSKKVTPCVE